MPSHICHALLVEKLLESLDSGSPQVAAVAILGSQGPDIFLHNHRRKPRAFRYGALLHRKGNARIISSLAESAARLDGLPFEELAAFTLGYISHVWLDRIAHPYVNYFAGWRGTPDRHPDRPAMHAFLERIIDVQLLRHLRNQSVQEFCFLERLPTSSRDLAELRTHIAGALRSTLRSAGDDTHLETRLANALFDSLAYYRNTESPGSEYFLAARGREKSGTLSPRWLSVIHPPEELLMVDALNMNRRPWQHPCSPSRTSNASFCDLFDKALVRTIEVFRLWLVCAREKPLPSPGRLRSLEEAVGEQNLNDGIVGDPPCRRTACDPLPLLELYHRIKTAFDR
ncbi:MAG: hypothetical protein EA427_09610 [Spirochaetaceae bacterium]|nr:MAG: hypothetical protein EA427_09610 [Spirochaetaceae bacterium]